MQYDNSKFLFVLINYLKKFVAWPHACLTVSRCVTEEAMLATFVLPSIRLVEKNIIGVLIAKKMPQLKRVIFLDQMELRFDSNVLNVWDGTRIQVFGGTKNRNLFATNMQNFELEKKIYYWLSEVRKYRTISSVFQPRLAVLFYSFLAAGNWCCPFFPSSGNREF